MIGRIALVLVWNHFELYNLFPFIKGDLLVLGGGLNPVILFI